MELLTITDAADHTADDKDDGANYWTDNDSNADTSQGSGTDVPIWTAVY